MLLRVPLAVLALGILLSEWGPLPGLCLFLIIGAVMGLAPIALLLLTDGMS